MKILCLIDNLGSGGAQRQMVTISNLLKDKSYDISFLVYHKDDFFKDKLDEIGISIHYILENRPLYRVLKIRRFIRSGGYNAVISFLETPNFLNCVSAIGFKTWKVITSERSSNISTFVSRRGKILSWFQRFSDVIVCNSYNAKYMWDKYFPNYRDKLTVVYNPVILPVITSKYIPKRNGKLNIVIAASYQYLKNPIGLIKALSLLNIKERDNLFINWYGRINVTEGDSKAYNEAKILIKEHQLENSIVLNEEVKDIESKFNEADIVALFSELEGLPNAICEGMMIGKPIIMTRFSDYATLVDNSNGFLCDWDSPESIKEVLIKAIDLSVEDLICLGNNSKNKASLMFSSDIIVKKWMDILEKNV